MSSLRSYFATNLTTRVTFLSTFATNGTLGIEMPYSAYASVVCAVPENASFAILPVPENETVLVTPRIVSSPVSVKLKFEAIDVDGTVI